MSKKRAKPPRKFGRKKVKPAIRIKQESWNRESRRLNDQTIAFMDELQPGFKQWYMESYDENGKYIGEKIPGLFG